MAQSGRNRQFDLHVVFLTKAFAAGPPARVSVVGLSQVEMGMGMGFDVAFWGRSFDRTTLWGILLLVVPTAWVLL